MRKKSTIGFLLASFGVVLLAFIPAFILLRKDYSEKLRVTVGQMRQPRDQIEYIDSSLELLYTAENNFRWYSLTGDFSREQQYNDELSDLSDLLDTITQRYDADSSLPGMLAAKQRAMQLLLRARLYADSLWGQASFLETHPLESPDIPGDVHHLGRAALADSVLTESYLVRRRSKGLLGRLKDAILNRPFARIDSVRTIKIQTGAKEGNEDSFPFLMTNENIDSTHLWSILLGQLDRAKGSIYRREIALLTSNEVLFDHLRETLNAVRDNEFAFSSIRNASIASNAGVLMQEFQVKKTLTISFIIVLALIILFFIWQFYRNGEALWHAKRNAEQLARLKTNFAATASHEIRGLSHAINASVEALNDKQPFSRRKELIHGMKQSWEMLTGMLNNILDYTRLEQAGKAILKAPFLPSKAIREVVDSLKVGAERKAIRLETVISMPESMTVSGNESQFKQILVNLVGNAIKFTSHGSVSVEAYSEQKGPEEIAVNIVVKDTGRGIQEKDLPLIFEEFQQIDPDKDLAISPGSGLGLAIVKRIIDRHDGKIEVKSKPGVGSAFFVHLRYKTAHSSPKRMPAAIVDKRSLSQLRVMAVEDELLHRKHLSKLLSRVSITVIEASGGREALSFLAQQDVDIVLTDINMPGMSGLELARNIRAMAQTNKAKVPIIALTATVSEDDIRQFKTAGMTDFILKPFTSEDLFKKLSDIVIPVSADKATQG